MDSYTQLPGMAMTSHESVRPPAAAVVRGDRRNTVDVRSRNGMTLMMARYLHRRIVESGWIRPEADPAAGLTLRGEDTGDYVSEPPSNYPELAEFCRRLGITAAFTMSCDLTDRVLQVPVTEEQHQHEVTLADGLTIPVVGSLGELATTDRTVRARDLCCLVRRERLMVVWGQSADGMVENAADMEEKLLRVFPHAHVQHAAPVHHHQHHNGVSMAGALPDQDNWQNHHLNKEGFRTPEVDELSELDAEEQASAGPRKRPFILTHSVLAGLAVCLLVITQSLNVRQILIEVKALGSAGYLRLAMLVTIPIFAFFSIFFFTTLVTALFQLVGPMQDIKTGRTRFYSSVKPDRRKHANIVWPHITVQVPVYKEGLKGVIQPTVESLLPAIDHYHRLGGTANIFVCEDGMQLVSEQVAELRQNFYRSHGIGWVARPGHGKDGFVRGGRFKKASNMNYCLDFSLRVEDRLLGMIAERRAAMGFVDDSQQLEIEEEERLYEEAFQTVLEGDGGKTQAEGNVRIGDIILLIDSDTRVPVDCLGLAAMEMEESPEVAIIQHASGVMNVTTSWFEAAITYFTNLIYAAVRFAVGNGDVAPFIGHNAFLRWRAVQSIKFTDPKDGRELFWSENHVSEDFDVALRLQAKGFVLRLATYDHGEFKEGVSLTVMDELLRWEKYAYGCSELLFNPLYQWIYKGPFAMMFYRMLGSTLKTTSKFTIMGYMGTYFAIACSLPLSLANYFIVGWLTPDLDSIYTDSWRIMVGCLVVFQGIAPVCFAVYRWRAGDMPLWRALWENIKWYWFFIIFFAGISWHLSYALLAHLLCLPIEWSSTVKELESTGFFISLENVMKYYKYSTAFCLFLIGGMVYLGQFAPAEWTINSWLCIVPLAVQITGHLLMPVLSIVY